MYTNMYGHGGHLCHVTIYIYFDSHFPWMLHVQLDFDLQRKQFWRRRCLKIMAILHEYSQGAWGREPCGGQFFHKHKS